MVPPYQKEKLWDYQSWLHISEAIKLSTEPSRAYGCETCEVLQFSKFDIPNLTAAKRGEFSGMIHFITSNNHHPIYSPIAIHSLRKTHQ